MNGGGVAYSTDDQMKTLGRQHPYRFGIDLKMTYGTFDGLML